MRSRTLRRAAPPSQGDRLRPSARSTATRRLSSTLSSGKISVIWNVRAMPSRTRASGGSFVTSCPSKRTAPALGENNPLMRLKNVVLPAPFGPMMARNSPGSTDSDTSPIAARLPKRLLRPSSLSSVMPPPRERTRRPAHAGRTAPQGQTPARSGTSSYRCGSTGSPAKPRRSPRRTAAPRTSAYRPSPP